MPIREANKKYLDKITVFCALEEQASTTSGNATEHIRRKVNM